MSLLRNVWLWRALTLVLVVLLAGSALLSSSGSAQDEPEPEPEPARDRIYRYTIPYLCGQTAVEPQFDRQDLVDALMPPPPPIIHTATINTYETDVTVHNFMDIDVDLTKQVALTMAEGEPFGSVSLAKAETVEAGRGFTVPCSVFSELATDEGFSAPHGGVLKIESGHRLDVIATYTQTTAMLVGVSERIPTGDSIIANKLLVWMKLPSGTSPSPQLEQALGRLGFDLEANRPMSMIEVVLPTEVPSVTGVDGAARQGLIDHLVRDMVQQGLDEADARQRAEDLVDGAEIQIEDIELGIGTSEVTALGTGVGVGLSTDVEVERIEPSIIPGE